MPPIQNVMVAEDLSQCWRCLWEWVAFEFTLMEELLELVISLDFTTRQASAGPPRLIILNHLLDHLPTILSNFIDLNHDYYIFWASLYYSVSLFVVLRSLLCLVWLPYVLSCNILRSICLTIQFFKIIICYIIYFSN